MKIQFPKHKAAFSLIETVIAISILAMVLLFSVTLGSVSLRNMTVKAQTTQATSLARTGIEKVRNIRDNAWLNSSYTSCTTDQWDCWVGLGHTSEVVPGSTYVITEGDQYYLTADSEASAAASKILQFGDNSQVEYKSTINITKVTSFSAPFQTTQTQIGGADTAQDLTGGTTAGTTTGNTKITLVESKVTWVSYGRSYQVSLKTYLSDWLPRF